MLEPKPPATHWIKWRRLELDLSQDDLVSRLELAGIRLNRSTLSNWETGKSAPPYHDSKFRKALAQSLNMTVTMLLDQAGYEVTQSRHSGFAEQAAFLFDEVDDEAKMIVMRLLLRFVGVKGNQDAMEEEWHKQRQVDINVPEVRPAKPTRKPRQK